LAFSSYTFLGLCFYEPYFGESGEKPWRRKKKLLKRVTANLMSFSSFKAGERWVRIK